MRRRRPTHKTRPRRSGTTGRFTRAAASRTPSAARRVVTGFGLVAVGVALGVLMPTAPRPAAGSATPVPDAHHAARGGRIAATAALNPIDRDTFVYSSAVFERLAEVRASKRAAIVALFADIRVAAQRIAVDETMRTCFATMREIATPAPAAGPTLSPEEAAALGEYRRVMTRYYALNYAQFYDILLISPEQYVFHSFRAESDLYHAIADDSALGAGLRASLDGQPHLVVVDYHDYAPSEHASAFFVMPITSNGRHAGWIVAQYTVNVLDALLVDHNELGRTGEVYLVNAEQQMLTDSRFSGERTHLRYRLAALDHETLHAAPSGEGLMIDYRGVPVFASYEQIDVFGQTWVLVAQIDEAEVITEHYREDPAGCRAALLAALRDSPQRQRPVSSPSGDPRRVGMDESAKTTATRPVETRGVSTCTAVVVTYPGRFSYLAHISPYDKIYGAPQLTNTLKQVIHGVLHYDIYQHELDRLRITIIAPHTKSLAGALDKLLRYGITLNQIRFAHAPGARYADVLAAPAGGTVQIAWMYDDETREPLVQWASDIPSVGTLLREHARNAH